MAELMTKLGDILTTGSSHIPADFAAPGPLLRAPDVRDRVYNGSPVESPSQGSTVQGRSRRLAKRSVSPFSIMLWLMAVAVAIILYISNILAVEQLLNRINQQQTQYQMLLSQQELLRAQVNRMASLERIRKVAEDDLGLRSPTQSPVWFTIDEDKVRKIDESLLRADARKKGRK
jgi:cell division protein FtsL